jgi:hypothetical protein
VSRLRWSLVVLLVASTALFAVGVSLERTQPEAHAESSAAQTAEPGGHEEEGEAAEGGEDGEAHSETTAGETPPEEERVLGADPESTPLLVLAVLAGLASAPLTASRLGRLRSVRSSTSSTSPTRA